MYTIILKIFKLLIICFTLITLIFSQEFEKNKDIKNSEKLNEKRSYDIDDLDEMNKIIYENKENSIVVFHTEWCPHW